MEIREFIEKYKFFLIILAIISICLYQRGVFEMKQTSGFMFQEGTTYETLYEIFYVKDHKLYYNPDVVYSNSIKYYFYADEGSTYYNILTNYCPDLINIDRNNRCYQKSVCKWKYILKKGGVVVSNYPKNTEWSNEWCGIRLTPDIKLKYDAISTPQSTPQTIDDGEYTVIIEIQSPTHTLKIHHDFTVETKPVCTDECSPGDTKCVGYKYYTCGNYDSDPCLEWSSGKIKIGKCGVECTTNSDCPSRYTCSNYKCEFEGECYSGETKCEGYYYYVCEDGEWDYKGIVIGKCGVECSLGKTKCEGYNYYECSNYKWKDKGKVIGKCGVECLEDRNCGETTVSDNYCYNRNVYRNITKNICQNYKCIQQTEKKLIEKCKYGCEGGECIGIFGFENLWYIAGGVIAFLIIMFSLIYYKLKL